MSRLYRPALIALLAFALLGGLLLPQNAGGPAEMTPEVAPSAGLAAAPPGDALSSAIPEVGASPSGATLSSPAGEPAAQASRECEGEWELVDSPAVQSSKNELRGVVAPGPNDAWAVGIAGGETLIQRWDGSRWSRAETPNPGIYRRLDGIAAAAANNIWAVGWYDTGNSSFAPLALHWNGTRWQQVNTPSTPPDSRLLAVSALAANDVWAVGSANGRAYSMHWDGTQWHEVSTPDTGPRSELNGVVALGPNDVWAVGGAGPKTLTMHWNGDEWAVVPSPNVHNFDRLYAVDALGPNDVWAVGGIILHWNGREWSVSDSTLAEGSAYRGVLAIAPDSIWAGGYGKSPGGANLTVVQRWDGKSWTLMQTPNPSQEGNQINALGGTSQGQVWAVGNSGPSQSFQPMVMRYPFSCVGAGPPEPGTDMPAPAPVPLPGEGRRQFPETGKAVQGIFLDYWNAHGGLAQQGYPVSEAIGEVSELNGEAYTVQYFQRAVFEYHPEHKGTPFEVLLTQLGTYQYRKKYPEGAPNQRPNAGPGSALFPETGKRVGGRFLEYWQQNGGLAQYGFPLSDEFQERSATDGKTYTVQYFERAVFEHHPENEAPFDVLLSLLGSQRWLEKYGKY